jgi:hypothetical protein
MTTPVVSSNKLLSAVTRDDSKVPAARTYRTKTSFVAVHLDEGGKGRIVFLPQGAMLRVIGPSACLREACEIIFRNELYNVFEIDLVASSILICEPIKTKSRVITACA